MRSLCRKDTSRSEWVCGPDFTTASSFALSSTESNAVDKNGEKISAQVIPNPNNGNFSIQMQLPATAASTTLALYNNVGAKVWQQDAGKIGGSVYRNIAVDKKLFAGTYMLMIERNDARLVQKIVINK
jgi:hypothetical protein